MKSALDFFAEILHASGQNSLFFVILAYGPDQQKVKNKKVAWNFSLYYFCVQLGQTSGF